MEKKNLFEEYFNQYVSNPVIRTTYKVLFYILGVISFLCALVIFMKPFLGIIFLLLGFMVFPPAFNFISSKIEKLKNLKVRIVIIILCLIALCLVPSSIKPAYINVPETKICAEPDGKTNCETFVKTSRIRLYPEEYKTGEYLRTTDGKWISEKAVVIRGSDEFEKMQQELGDDSSTPDLLITPEEAKLQVERKAYLEKIFSKIEINKYSFTFYINPIYWGITDIEKKKELMNVCASYGMIATRQVLDVTVALGYTRIKSSTDGKDIGKYNPVSGFDFK